MSATPNSRVNISKFLMSERGDIIRAALAEFIGTAILVLFTCGTCVASGQRPDTLVATALSFGLTIICLAATLGHVSGCHVNPGVTVGLFLNGQINLIRGGIYIIAQLLGGTAGAALLAGVLKTGAKELCATRLHGLTPLQGIIVETAIVFILVFVICNVCESNSNLAPITIGLAISAGHLFAIPLTSSSMNTARSFGPAIIQGYWEDHYVYWIGPLLGGALGGLAHRFLFQNKTLYTKCASVPSGEPTNVTTTI